jgi:hypothetical protein
LNSLTRRIAAAAVAAAAAVTAIGITTTATRADTAVGFDAGASVGDTSLDAGFVQELQSTLDSQFVGVDVAVVRDRLVLSGFASPGVHTAVLAVVANLLQQDLAVPVGLGVVTPALGLNLPFLDVGAGIELPDLTGVLRLLGVVDRIQIIR